MLYAMQSARDGLQRWIFRIFIPWYVTPCTGFFAPAPNRRGIKGCFCLTSDVYLTSVCLSRTSGVTRDKRGLGRLRLAQR